MECGRGSVSYLNRSLQDEIVCLTLLNQPTANLFAYIDKGFSFLCYTLSLFIRFSILDREHRLVGQCDKKILISLAKCRSLWAFKVDNADHFTRMLQRHRYFRASRTAAWTVNLTPA